MTQSRKQKRKSDEPGKRIEGIECLVKGRLFQRAISKVLRQIKSRCPADFARIIKCVHLIRPLSKQEKEAEERELGAWIPDAPTDDDPSSWGSGYMEPCSGVMVLKDEGARSEGDMMATVAHELGHAATVDEDIAKRNAPCEEWGAEAAADWYAYKWGFGRLIAAHRSTRVWTHHGVRPGGSFEMFGRQYRMTRDFVFHRELPVKRRPT